MDLRPKGMSMQRNECKELMAAAKICQGGYCISTSKNVGFV